jgi:hypothetical protein
MTLEDLAALGYACGLSTLDEALLMVQMHYDAFTVDQHSALYASIRGVDLDQRCADVLGPERCALEDRLLHEALSKAPSDDSTEFP